jgi:nitroreductase
LSHSRIRLHQDNINDRIGVLENLLGQRFSWRAFLPGPVPRATIERILAAAQKTASWCNGQPWRLEVTSGRHGDAYWQLVEPDSVLLQYISKL